MIKLIDLLKEIKPKKIYSGKRLGAGGTFDVYQHATDSNKVVKVFSREDDSDPKEIKKFLKELSTIFKSNPKYFPKVYEVGDDYIVLEKLNIAPTEELEKKLESLKKKFLTLKNPNLPKSIRDHYKKEPYDEYGEELAPQILGYIYRFNINSKFNSKEFLDNEFNYLVRQDLQVFEMIQKLYELYKNTKSTFKKFPEYIQDPDEVDFHGGNIGMDTQGNFKMVDF